ncbi:MAG: dihydropteroate synthase [Hyphomicrobium sp. SCN 65-11]|nr:MAG: dihydropteroate synthase [Hyphomicrobium sp. SCN 65-11]
MSSQTDQRTYVRPTALLTPSAHTPRHDAIRIAGRTDLVATTAELIRRPVGAPRNQARYLTASELRADAAGDRTAAALLARHEAPRPPLAGLTLDEAVRRPRLMGIVNVTPDSFSDGGAFSSAQTAIDHALQLEAEGADILDIGGESTRPGAHPVSIEEELARVIPVIEGLAGKTKALISIDTRKAEVMRRALAAGAHIINDVAALTYEPACLEIAAASNAPVILMHAQGDPRTMQAAPEYDDCLLDVCDWLEARLTACEAAGIARDRLVIDPGIGFGKTLVHNLELLAGLTLLHGLGVPVLLGASRKSFIGMLTGEKDARQRVPGSIAAALAGASQGAQILRVHDVAETRQALTVWEAMRRGAT